MSVGVFCIQLDAFALNLALPQIGRDLHADSGGLQWVVSAYLLSTGTLMLGAGRLGDLFGRRRLLVLGLTLFGMSSLVCALAPTLPVLVGARVAQGAGAAMIMPVGLSLLTNLYPSKIRGRAIGWALGIGGIATACGPFVGGFLTDTVSWRAVFWLNVPLAAAGAVAAHRVDESFDNDHHRQIDWLGLVTITAALAALAIVVDRVRIWPLSASMAGIILVFTLLTLFLYRERLATNALVDLALFRNGPFVALTLAGAVANAAMVMLLFVVPLTLQGQWSLPVVTAGVAFLIPALAMALSGPLAGRIVPSVAVPAMILFLLGAAASLLCLVWAPSLTVYLTAATLAGATLGAANALTLIATQGVITPERAGEASGVTKTVITVAAGLSVAMAGAVTDGNRGIGSQAASETALQITAISCLGAALVLGLWTLGMHARQRWSISPA
ncbi:MFS transporter [Mycobacteroides chelonae]|uniref:MFS transporter n=1 Tax=Mycobacteroides chelonae TaxID=1774 RepID=UPI0008A99C5B|nr:MFS transporter [Mycobacteroides chelonae]OHU53464.1 MFS transporter [Mycobacteroides chelonae]